MDVVVVPPVDHGGEVAAGCRIRCGCGRGSAHTYYVNILGGVTHACISPHSQHIFPMSAEVTTMPSIAIICFDS